MVELFVTLLQVTFCFYRLELISCLGLEFNYRGSLFWGHILSLQLCIQPPHFRIYLDSYFIFVPIFTFLLGAGSWPNLVQLNFLNLSSQKFFQLFPPLEISKAPTFQFYCSTMLASNEFLKMGFSKLTEWSISS